MSKGTTPPSVCRNMQKKQEADEWAVFDSLEWAEIKKELDKAFDNIDWSELDEELAKLQAMSFDDF